jgi:DNA replication protein DnaC
LLLLGKVGTGKDHLAYAIARYAIMRGYSARWLNCMRWYATVRDNIQSEASQVDAIRRLVQPNLLVLNDPLPPVGDLTAWQLGNLFQVIDGRYGARKSTIVTANMDSESDGDAMFGPQVWDRLCDRADLVWFRWPSYRQPNR